MSLGGPIAKVALGVVVGGILLFIAPGIVLAFTALIVNTLIGPAGDGSAAQNVTNQTLANARAMSNNLTGLLGLTSVIFIAGIITLIVVVYKIVSKQGGGGQG
jgi:hypothetical protein